jgi:hypothetical protein
MPSPLGTTAPVIAVSDRIEARSRFKVIRNSLPPLVSTTTSVRLPRCTIDRRAPAEGQHDPALIPLARHIYVINADGTGDAEALAIA